jgi:excisionase family DNA binding protein
MGMTDEDRRRLKGGFVIVEPMAAPIPDACRYSGLSRSEIYRCLADGRIQAVKSGARTLILMDTVRAHLATLPRATFRAPPSAAQRQLRKY